MLIDLLELAANNALQHDTKAKQGLARLHGKNIGLSIRSAKTLPIQYLTISPHPHGLEFTDGVDEHNDVSLSASLPALIKISRDGIDDADLAPGELEINGDAIVGQRFAQVLGELNIDWLGLMADHLGETPAVLLYGGISKASELVSDSKTAVKSQLSQLLHEDLAILADKHEVESFLNSVDNLRADTDKLSTRIKQLQSLSGN